MTLDDLERFRDEWRNELNKHGECSTQGNGLNCREDASQCLTSAWPRQGNCNEKCGCNNIHERLTDGKLPTEQNKSLANRKRASGLTEAGFKSEENCAQRDSSGSLTSSVPNSTSRASGPHEAIVKCKKTKLTLKEHQPREDTKNLSSPVQEMVKENFLEILIADIDETVSLPFFDLELPKEIAIKIFLYLEIKDLGHCACVNTKWKILAEDDMIWYYMCQRNGYVSDEICALDREGWKQHFMENFISGRTFTQNWKQRICQISELEYEKGGILYAASAFKDKVIAGYANGLIKLWDIFKEAPAASFGSLVSESEAECDYDNAVSFVATNDNICAAAYNNGDVKLWLNRFDFPLLHTYNAGSKMECLSLNKKSSAVISACERKFRVDATNENGQWCNVFQRILGKKITSAQFYNHDDSHKAVISTKDAVEVHCKDGQVDEIECTVSAEISCLECQDDFITVALTPLDFSILDGYRVKLFTASNGHLKHIMKGPHSLISCLCSYDDHLTAVGCSDKKIRVHDHRTENPMMSMRGLSGSPCSLQIDDWKVVSGDTSGSISVWDQRTVSLLWQTRMRHPVRICHTIGPCLVCVSIPVDRNPRETFWYADDLIQHRRYRGNIRIFDFNVDNNVVGLPEICQSNYDTTAGYNYNINLAMPYDNIS